jgi:Photosynthetic reaction centre cytochrome C subunit
MTFRLGPGWFWSLALLCVATLGVSAAARQAPLDAAAQVSEKVFKDIQVLKGIPADEFMDTMGMFSSSLLFDCTGCHVDDILTNRAAFAVTTPRITKARQMVAMVNSLNRTFFTGQPRVTCFTCHRGNATPEVEPDLALQYGDVSSVRPNAMTIFPDRQASADQVFSKYLQAIGGAARAATLTSYVATGNYTGFNTSGLEVPIEIFAKAPDQRATVVRLSEGDAVKTFDGRSAWAAEDWRQLPLMSFTGGNLAGARFEAIVAFPVGIQKAFSQWQLSSTVIEDRDVQLLQGANPGQLPVNLYFDESGLLVRTVRWNRTPVGTVPTQTDYSDYRDVAGVKVPFRMVVTWTNGQNTIALREVRPNVAIDAARFARPAPFTPRR